MTDRETLDAREVLTALQDLIDSIGWRVLFEDLKARLALAERALYLPSDTQSLADVRLLQGRVSEIRWLLERPNNRIREIRASFAARSQ